MATTSLHPRVLEPSLQRCNHASRPGLRLSDPPCGVGLLSSTQLKTRRSNMKFKYAKLLLLGMLMFSIPLLINSHVPAGVSFAQQQQQEVEYSCPMHPEVRSKTGGSCPKCGMTLKKVSKPDVPAATASSQGGGNH